MVNRLQELARASKIMGLADGSYIRHAISVVRSKAFPVRSKNHLKTSDELVDLGFRLMESATDSGDLDQALAFRDGLVLAFLALHPIRGRNLADFKLGRNLIRQSSGFSIAFARNETKNGDPYEARVADILVEPMNKYLDLWRPILAARTGRWKGDLDDAVWVSSDGSQMSQEGLAGRIKLRTKSAFGKAINPHLFRDAAATTLAIADPAHVRVAATLLGHRSPVTTEKYYRQATGLQAQRTYLQAMEELKSGGPNR